VGGFVGGKPGVRWVESIDERSASSVPPHGRALVDHEMGVVDLELHATSPR